MHSISSYPPHASSSREDPTSELKRDLPSFSSPQLALIRELFDLIGRDLQDAPGQEKAILRSLAQQVQLTPWVHDKSLALVLSLLQPSTDEKNAAAHLAGSVSLRKARALTPLLDHAMNERILQQLEDRAVAVREAAALCISMPSSARYPPAFRRFAPYLCGIQQGKYTQWTDLPSEIRRDRSALSLILCAAPQHRITSDILLSAKKQHPPSEDFFLEHIALLLAHSFGGSWLEERFLEDPDLMIQAAPRAGPRILAYASETLRANQKWIVCIAKLWGTEMLLHASTSLRSSEKCIKELLKLPNGSLALAYVDPSPRACRTFMESACKEAGAVAFAYADPSIWLLPEEEETISHCMFLLEDSPVYDMEFTQSMLKKFGEEIMEYLPEELKTALQAVLS